MLRAAARFLVFATLVSFWGPPSAAQSNDFGPIMEIVDARGDTTLFGGVGPLPATAATDPFDLVAVRVTGDTVENFTLEVEIADFDGPVSTNDPFGITSDFWTEVYFRVQGHSARFGLVLFSPYGQRDINDPGPTGHVPVFAIFCLTFEEFDGCQSYQDVEAEAWIAENKFVATVPKLSLLGRAPTGGGSPGPGEANFPTRLEKGDKLHDWQIYTRILGGLVEDSAPDQGQPMYQFQQPTANTKVSLGLRDPGIAWGRDLVVVPGVTNAIPLRIQNLAEGKRILNLTTRVVGSGGDWEVALAPSVEVPAGQERTLDLVLRAGGDIAHRATAQLIIEGRPLGVADEVALLRLRLVAAVTPSPRTSTLFFHASHEPAAGLVSLCFDLDELNACDYRQYWLNTLAEDPRGNRDAEGVAISYSSLRPVVPAVNLGPLWHAQFWMDTPLGSELILDLGKPLELRTGWSARHAFSATLVARVLAGDSQLAESETQIAIGTSPTAVDVPLPLAVSQPRLARATGPINVELELRATDPNAAASGYGGLTFLPKSSQLVMPLLEDPLAGLTVVGGQRFTLHALNGTEEFLNPGRTKILNLLLTNEGLDTGETRVQLEAASPDWPLRLEPAPQFRLAPGESVVVALIAQAPADAQEGDPLRVQVTAVAVEGGTPTSRLNVTFVATAGIDIPDEQGQYRADPAALERAVDGPAKGTPGAGAVPLLAGLGGAVAWRRRRRA